MEQNKSSRNKMKDIVRDILDLPKDIFLFLRANIEPTVVFWIIAIGYTLYLILNPTGAN